MTTGSDGGWFIIRLLLNALNSFSAINTRPHQLTDIIRHKVCRFQYEYANFQVLTSQLHRSFKVAFEKDPSSCHNEYNNLLTHIDQEYLRLCSEITEYIEDYFTQTHSFKNHPRIGILQGDDRTPQNVTCIYMLHSTNHFEYKNIDNHFILKKIENSGRPFLTNNLPKTILKDSDFNTHGLNFDLNKIRNEYKLRIRDKKYFSIFFHNIKKGVYKTDKKWIDISKGMPDDYLSASKSILVVPITFKQHASSGKLNPDLIKLLNIPKNGRAILGFIYIDYPDTYYFDDTDPTGFNNLDINALYIFADLFSLIILAKLMYIEGSKTVSKYKISIGE